MPSLKELADMYGTEQGYEDRLMAAQMQPVPRDPAYQYGSILPFRKNIGTGAIDWGLMYSDLAKSLVDAFTAPRRAYAGGQMRQDEGMNMALSMIGANAPIAQLKPGELGAVGWHGSPHKFDKFDSSKIGTGEGAQAYGHGLYLAENPEVATGYQKALAHKAPRIQDEAGLLADYQTTVKGRNAWVFTDESVLIETADGAGFKLAASLRDLRKKAASDSQAFEVASRTDFAPQAKSNLYKVDLPDAMITKMLDWDKPLSQQSAEVQRAIAASGHRFPPNATGEQIHSAFASRAVSDLDPAMRGASGENRMAGAEAMRAAGIPGIKYLDQGSRGAGQGTRNFVVFDPSTVKILDRK